MSNMQIPLRLEVIKTLICAFLLSTITGFAFQGFPQSQDVESITIRSSWTGLAPTLESVLSIQQKNGTFRVKGKKINPKHIDELFLQIGNKSIQTLESLGITQDWLNRNALKAIPSGLKESLPIEKEFFKKSFCDIDLIKKILPRLFNSWTDSKGGFHLNFSTDDYPEFKMTILRKDASEIVVSSTSQNLFMFDNPSLGRAIAALLPNKFTNRERLMEISWLLKLGKKFTKKLRTN
jgi:hypothetical protein